MMQITDAIALIPRKRHRFVRLLERRQDLVTLVHWGGERGDKAANAAPRLANFGVWYGQADANKALCIFAEGIARHQGDAGFSE